MTVRPPSSPSLALLVLEHGEQDGVVYHVRLAPQILPLQIEIFGERKKCCVFIDCTENVYYLTLKL